MPRSKKEALSDEVIIEEANDTNLEEVKKGVAKKTTAKKSTAKKSTATTTKKSTSKTSTSKKSSSSTSKAKKDSSKDSEEKPVKKATRKTTKKEVADEAEEKPIKKTTRRTSKKEAADDAEEKPVKKTTRKTSKKEVADDAEEKPIKKTTRRTSKKEVADDAEEKPVKKTTRKTAKKEVADDAEEKPVKKTTRKTAKKEVDDEAEEKPAKKTTRKKSSTTSKKTTTKKSTQSKTVAKKTSSKKVASKKKSEEPETLQETFENIVEYYDLPYRYNQTVVRVLAQNPNTLFVYWDVSDQDVENFKKEYGENFFNSTKPILLVNNLTDNYSFEIQINDFANNWYIHVNDTKCRYSVQLCRRPREQNVFSKQQIADLVNISYSNTIEIPNDHVLFFRDNDKIYFKNIKSNKVTEKVYKANIHEDDLKAIYQNYNLSESEDRFDLKNPSSNNPTSNVM